MKIRLIVNGICGFGYNRCMTEEGLEQVRATRDNVLRSIPRPPLIVVGNSLLYRGIYRVIASFFNGVPVKRSPFLGSADGLEKDGHIAVEDGKIPAGDYIGLRGTRGFDAWEFLKGLPENTLLCGGEELMLALGLGEHYVAGQLYELDTDIKDGFII